MLRKIRDLFRRSSKPKMVLHDLILMSLDRMKIDKVICPHCKNEMVFRTSHIYIGYPARDDIAFKCMNCFHTCHFGIPIERWIGIMEIKLRGSEWLLNPTYNPRERKSRDIRKRLRELGYIE